MEVIRAGSVAHGGRWRRAVTRIAKLAVLGAASLAVAGTGVVLADNGNNPRSFGENDRNPPHTTFRPPPIIYRPSDVPLSRSAPLLIALHALGGTPRGFELTSRWNSLADRYHFVVAYLGSPQPAWKDPTNIGYVNKMIDRLVLTQNIDPRRVFVTGFSAGGFMSFRAACYMNIKVTAVAPVSGGQLPTPCKVSRPISVFAMIGTRDAIPASHLVTTIGRWRAYDGCVGQAVLVRTRLLTKRTWTHCADGTTVALWVIHGGVHTYPGAPGLSPSSPDGQLDATQVIWSFFSTRVAGSPTKPSVRLVSVRQSGGGQLGVDTVISADEAVTIVERLLRGQSVVAIRNFSVKLSQTRALPISVPRGAPTGGYMVALSIRDGYGRQRVIKRQVAVGG